MAKKTKNKEVSHVNENIESPDLQMESALSFAQKKEIAKQIFISDLTITQKEVAEKVGISEKSMSKWVRDEDWSKLRKSLLNSKQQVLSSLYTQLEELNNAIQKKPEGQRYMHSKEADIYIKVTAAIKNLTTEVSLTQHMESAKAFMDWLRKVDLDKAKEYAILYDGFIKSIM